MGGIEAVEAEAGGGHFVKGGGLEVGMAIVGGFIPAVIVTHAEDDVGAVGDGRRRGGRGEEGEKVPAGMIHGGILRFSLVSIDRSELYRTLPGQGR